VSLCIILCFFFFQAEDGIRYFHVTGVQTCALPIFRKAIIIGGKMYSKIRLIGIDIKMVYMLYILLFYFKFCVGFGSLAIYIYLCNYWFCMNFREFKSLWINDLNALFCTKIKFIFIK